MNVVHSYLLRIFIFRVFAELFISAPPFICLLVGENFDKMCQKVFQKESQ